MAASIRRGELLPGTRLTPERQLAAQLGVSRTTVINAYRELEARGYIRGQVGRGTYVCAVPGPGAAPLAWQAKLAWAVQHPADPLLGGLLQVASQPAMVSFALGAPALEEVPHRLPELLADALARDPAARWHGPAEGQPVLRQALAARLRVRAEEVMVVSGASQGLDLLCRCLVERGESVLVERPVNRVALQVFAAAGARLVGWDFPRADSEQLEDLILRYRPKLLYTNPTYQNPTGQSLSLAQRKELLALAVRYQLPVIEDDAYRELGLLGSPPPSLRALDDWGIVVSLGTFSKLLGPGLRVGWVVAAPALVRQLAQLRLRSDLHTSNVLQLALAELLRTGALDWHVRRLRSVHRERLETMVRAIARDVPRGALRFRPPEGGIFLWCRLGPGLDASRLLTRGLAMGVLIAAGPLFYPDGGGREEVRLCFASCPPPAIEEGIRRLGQAIAAELAEPAGPPDERALV
ncbi:MAG: PLP-dependent aminotransferase family protein [Chloroflexi bacterium]|nr:PLP-dependent aminotransferase family protein [Chloroflexota bacterium]